MPFLAVSRNSEDSRQEAIDRMKNRCGAGVPFAKDRQIMFMRQDVDWLPYDGAGSDTVGSRFRLAANAARDRIESLRQRANPLVAHLGMQNFALAIADTHQRRHPNDRGLEHIYHRDACLAQIGIEG